MGLEQSFALILRRVEFTLSNRVVGFEHLLLFYTRLYTLKLYLACVLACAVFCMDAVSLSALYGCCVLYKRFGLEH